MNITGDFSGVGQKYANDSATVNGAFYIKNTSDEPREGVTVSNSGARDDWFGFDASRSWTGSTSTAGAHTHTVSVNNNGAHSHTITVGNSGSGTAMSLVQPSKAVARWLRTA